MSIHDDGEFRFHHASTHEGYLRQNGIIIWFGIEIIIIMGQVCMKTEYTIFRHVFIAQDVLLFLF